MIRSEKASAKKEAEELRKELEDCKDEMVNIYRLIGKEYYDLVDEGKINILSIPQQLYNDYVTIIDSYKRDKAKLVKQIMKLGFTIQEKQGHYELVTMKVEELITEPSKAEQAPVKDTIICTCGAEVSRNSMFCSSCGKKVEDLIAEPSKAEQVSVKECICGAKIQPGQFMCLECGRKIE